MSFIQSINQTLPILLDTFFLDRDYKQIIIKSFIYFLHFLARFKEKHRAANAKQKYQLFFSSNAYLYILFLQGFSVKVIYLIGNTDKESHNYKQFKYVCKRLWHKYVFFSNRTTFPEGKCHSLVKVFHISLTYQNNKKTQNI